MIKGIRIVHTSMTQYIIRPRNSISWSNISMYIFQDPHYVGSATSIELLVNQGYIRWQNASDFEDSSFYNVCLPLHKYAIDEHLR